MDRKSVQVTFVGDDDVVQHIIDAHDRKSKLQGVSVVNNLDNGGNDNGQSQRFVQEALLTMGRMVQAPIIEAMKMSPYYAILIDETTDVQTVKEMVVYVRYLKDNRSETNFMKMVPLQDGTASTITTAIFEFLSDVDLPTDRMCALGSDGASVMLGKRTGVAARLKEQIPHVIANHCVAHRLALAVSQSTKNIKYLATFKAVLDQLFRFYRNSPVRMAALHDIQTMLNDPILKLKQAKDVRWLSHDNATRTLAKCLPSVLASLEREAQERGDTQAMGLSVFLQNPKFLASLQMMRDILPHLSALSKAMQARDAVYTTVGPLVNGTVAVLRALKQSPGENFSAAVDNMEKLKRDGFNVKPMSGDELADFKETIHDQFIDNIVTNLTSRFEDLPLIQRYNVFDATCLPDDAECLREYGNEDIKALASHFSLDEGRAIEEWTGIKATIKETATLERSRADSIMEYITTLRESHPVLYKVAATGLLLPTSTADLRSRTRKSSLRSNKRKHDVESETSDSDAENIQNRKPIALEDDGNLCGGDLYKFRTPKKSGQMAQVASEARTPKSILRTPNVAEGTPKKSVNFTPTKAVSTPTRSKLPSTPTGRLPSTPTGRLPSTLTGRVPSTPTGRRVLRQRKPAATTPYRLHKRHDTGETDSEDSLDSSDEDSDASDDKMPSTPSTPLARKRLIKEDIDMPNGMEEYFDIHAGNAGPTSDATLSRLNIPRMDQQALSDTLASVPTGHIAQCGQMYTELRALFHEWMYNMCNGFNILLYGLGSKRNLIEDFQKCMVQDFSHVVVNGYFPSLTVKHILNCITEDILNHSGSFKTPLDQCDFIRTTLEQSDQDVYLIVHNIDGPMLRAEKAQNVLSLLSQVPGFHIIASIDHINSTLIWDQSKCSRFNWLWTDATTFSSYKEETSYENSLLVQQSGALALSSLTHVMKSLTPNAKGIFLLLAKYQLENQDNSLYIGMSLQDLYQRCREAFLVNSDLTLQAQLTEFRDHKMIRSKKSFDGVEHLSVPVDGNTLTEFVEQQDDV